MYAHLYRYNTNSKEKEIIDVEAMNSKRCRDNLTFFHGHALRTRRARCSARDTQLSRNKRGNKRNAFFRS